jgi:adhesin transport system membrane fusion protein
LRSVEVTEMAAAKTQAAVFSARADLAAAKGELLGKRAERLRKGADLDVKIAKEQATLQKTRGAEAKARAELAKAEVKLSRQQRMKIHAPRAGTIARVLVKEGSEFVKAGTPLALLVPDVSEQAVAIWIDGNDVPLVQPGRQVRLQFEGWPAVQFSGWPSVAVGTFGGVVRFVDARAERDGRFRVVIGPGEERWPAQRYLRQGARVKAWVLLDTVSLGYEAWRKLNGFPPTAKDASSERGGSK